MNNIRGSQHQRNDYDRLTPSDSHFVHGAQSSKNSMINGIGCMRSIQGGRVLAIRVRIPRPIFITLRPS